MKFDRYFASLHLCQLVPYRIGLAVGWSIALINVENRLV